MAAPALRELVSFHTAEHIRDEIRRIDGSVHHTQLQDVGLFSRAVRKHFPRVVCIYSAGLPKNRNPRNPRNPQNLRNPYA